MYARIVKAATNVEKCIALLETFPSVEDSADAVQLQVSEQDISSKRTGGVEFNNVSFRYKTDDNSIGGLQNISFNVRPGRMLGIVGPSGMFRRVLSFSFPSGILTILFTFYLPPRTALYLLLLFFRTCVGAGKR